MKSFYIFLVSLIILISSCDKTGKKVFMPDGNIYSNPTIKTLQESGYSVLFLPYSGYSIPTFEDTLFANTHLLLEGNKYYFEKSELSEETKVKGFATIISSPKSSMENIVEVLINEPSIQSKVIGTKIQSKDKAQIILTDNLMLEIEKEKGTIFCKTRKH